MATAVDEEKLKEELELKKERLELEEEKKKLYEERANIAREKEIAELKEEESKWEKVKSGAKTVGRGVAAVGRGTAATAGFANRFTDPRVLAHAISSGLRKTVSFTARKAVFLLFILLLVGVVLVGWGSREVIVDRVSIWISDVKTWLSEHNLYKIYTGYLERQIGVNTGLYAEGVQETNKKDIGFRISKVEFPTGLDYTEGENLIVWGELKGENIHDINGLEDFSGVISLSCNSSDGEIGTVDPSSFDMMEFSGMPMDFTCTIGDVKPGTKTVSVYAYYPFRTDAVKDAVYIKKDRLRSYSDDYLKKWQQKLATFSKGPAKIGADIGGNFPIPVDSKCTSYQDGCSTAITFTVDKNENWLETASYFEYIKDFKVSLADGIEIRDCAPIRMTDENDDNVWNSVNSDTEKYLNKTGGIGTRCRLAFTDYDAIFGDADIAVQGIPMSVQYNYFMKRSTQSIVVKKRPVNPTA